MGNPYRTRAGWRMAIAAAIALSIGGHALAGDENRGEPANGWTAVDATRLASMRGGFVTQSGLILSLGIERSVSINGTIVAQTNLHIGDVRALGSADAAALANALQPVITQRGSHNLLPASADQLSAGIFVQNTLNDQAIGTRTVISTTVNSGSLLKEMNFMSSVRDANIGAIAPRN
jgi:hypothetical protein